jgi:hypothetical protein
MPGTNERVCLTVVAHTGQRAETCGLPATGQPLRLVIGNREWQLHLCADHEKAIQDDVEPYLTGVTATRVAARTPNTYETPAGLKSAKELRQLLKSNGVEVGTVGRLTPEQIALARQILAQERAADT